MDLKKIKFKTGTAAIYVLALMLVGLGYWNYVSTESNNIQTVAETQTENSEDENLGDAQFVSSNDVTLETKSTQSTETRATGNVADFQSWLNSTYSYKLAVDNIFGADSKKHSIMALQTEFNKQLGSRLLIDGIFGSATKGACPVLRSGMSGNITKLVQFMLIAKGYSVGSYGADGIYGNATINAIKSFQSKNGLVVDGLCGFNTFEKLFK